MNTTKTYRYVVFVPHNNNITTRNFRDKFDLNGYVPMAIVTATSVQEVFDAGNYMAQGIDYQVIGSARSISVGDVIVREDAEIFVYVVESIGFHAYRDYEGFIEGAKELMRLFPVRSDTNLIDGFTKEEIRFMEDGKKIGAIRSYRERSREDDGCGNMLPKYGLKEAKDTVEDYMHRNDPGGNAVMV